MKLILALNSLLAVTGAQASLLRRQAQATDDDTDYMLLRAGKCIDFDAKPVTSWSQCQEAAKVLAFRTTSSNPGNSKPGCRLMNSGVVAFNGSSNNYSCSPALPCLCETPRRKTPVCSDDGVFQPDPDQYYVITSNEGKALLDSGFPHVVEMSNAISLDNVPKRNATTSTHWRFVQEDNGQWKIMSRYTGLMMGASDSNSKYGEASTVTKKEGLVYSFWENDYVHEKPLWFTPTCNSQNTGVELHSKNKQYSITSEAEGYTYAKLSDGWNVYQRKGTGCTSKSVTCESAFGPNAHRASRKLCGTWHEKHALECHINTWHEHKIGATVPQYWRITPVDQFMRITEPNNNKYWEDDVTIYDKRSTSNSPATVSESMALIETFGGVAAAAFATSIQVAFCPLCGAMTTALAALAIGTGADFLFGTDAPEPFDIEGALRDLEREILGQVETMMDEALALQGAAQARDNFQGRREWFYKDYRTRKHFLMEKQDMDELELLSGVMLTKLDEFKVDIKTFFGIADNFRHDTQTARRLEYSFDILKLAWTELMLMEQENLLLESYTDSSYTCAELLELNTVHDDVQEARDMLTKTVDLIFDVLVQDGPSYFLEERQFDFANLSYNIKPQLAFLDGFTNKTLTLCEELRTNDEYRYQFETGDHDFVPIIT